MDYSLCPWNSPGKITGGGSHSLLQEIFLTQELNLGVLQYRQFLYDLIHQGIHKFKSSNTIYLNFLIVSFFFFFFWILQSVQFISSVVSDSLLPRGLQHTSPPCSSPTPGIYSNSCPLSRWCHPTISSSVVHFSSCLQSFPASGSFQMSQFFA